MQACAARPSSTLRQNISFRCSARWFTPRADLRYCASFCLFKLMVGLGTIRTSDLTLIGGALCQLSYRPKSTIDRSTQLLHIQVGLTLRGPARVPPVWRRDRTRTIAMHPYTEYQIGRCCSGLNAFTFNAYSQEL